MDHRLIAAVLIGILLSLINFKIALKLNELALKKNPATAQAIVLGSMIIRLSVAFAIIFAVKKFFNLNLVALLLSFVIAFSVVLIAEVKILLSNGGT